MNHEVGCASLVAFLEGLHRLDFPETHAFTLANLERRVAGIERAVGGITAPPPHESYSWNGIVWRLWRADLKTRLVTYSDFDRWLAGMASMLEENYTTESLRRVVDRLGYDLPEIKCPREGEECEACLVAVVQKLAYVAGRLGQRPPMEPLSSGTIYAFAAWLGEEFGLYGAAPRHQPEAPIWPALSNAERAAAPSAAGPGYGPTGWTTSREPISSQYNPPSIGFNEREHRRTVFPHGDPRGRATAGQDVDHGTASNQNDPRGTALDQNENREDALNQHNPQDGAFNLVSPPTTSIDQNGNREDALNQHNPPDGAFNLISPPRDGAFNLIRPPRDGAFYLISPPRDGAFNLISPPRDGAFNLISPPTTSIDQNGNREDALNQHSPRDGAFNLISPPTTSIDHDSRPGLAVDTDIPRDAGLGSNVHERVTFDPESPHRPGFAPPASVSTAPASRAPTPSRPASAGSDNGGPSVPAAAAQRPQRCSWIRGMGGLRSRERGRRQGSESSDR